MMFTAKEQELLYKAFDLYSRECYEAYDFEKDSELQYSEEFEEKMQRLIRRHKKPYYRLINTAAKRVACIVAALLIAAAGTVLSVDALREGVKNFIVEVYEKFSRVTFQEDSDAPDTIEEYYAPCFLPEGYELSEIDKETWIYSIEYKNENNNTIFYQQQCIGNEGEKIDTEDTVTEELDKGLYIWKSKVKTKTFTWSDGKYYYMISAHESISKDDIIKMADSLTAE